jgi:hypothetical protein
MCSYASNTRLNMAPRSLPAMAHGGRAGAAGRESRSKRGLEAPASLTTTCKDYSNGYYYEVQGHKIRNFLAWPSTIIASSHGRLLQ